MHSEWMFKIACDNIYTIAGYKNANFNLLLLVQDIYFYYGFDQYIQSILI